MRLIIACHIKDGAKEEGWERMGGRESSTPFKWIKWVTSMLVWEWVNQIVRRFLSSGDKHDHTTICETSHLLAQESQ